MGKQKTKIKIGDIYGKLTVIAEDLKAEEEYFIKTKKHLRFWICECSCKNENKNTKTVRTSYLTSGRTQSCGCLHKEVMHEIKKKYNKYNLTGEYGIGYTQKGEEFYFDLEDYDKIKDYCWYIDKESNYVFSRIDGKIIGMHNIVTNVKNTNICPDHINRIRYDNRKQNLRIATYQENSFNRSIQKNNTSGVTGVYFCNTRRKWKAYLEINKKRMNLGSFTHKDDAIKVRLMAEKEYFKEFAPQKHLFEQYGIE